MVAEFAQAAVVIQNKSWGLGHRKKIVEDLLRGFVMVPESNRSCLALATEKDRPCLRLHVLMPSEDKSTYGQEKRQIPPNRFPVPKEDGAVVEWTEGRFAVRSPQGVESKARLPILKGWAKKRPHAQDEGQCR